MSSNIGNADFWRKCTTCKKPIGYGGKYWICSVSTCNRVRTDLVFCDLRCFDAHVPVLNHRDAGAFERKAPAKATLPIEMAYSRANDAQSKNIQSTPPSGGSLLHNLQKNEILVVVSKVKDYIRNRSGMNTSGAVMEVLSDAIRGFAQIGMEKAKKAGRQTVLDRDIRE